MCAPTPMPAMNRAGQRAVSRGKTRETKENWSDRTHHKSPTPPGPRATRVTRRPHSHPPNTRKVYTHSALSPAAPSQRFHSSAFSLPGAPPAAGSPGTRSLRTVAWVGPRGPCRLCSELRHRPLARVQPACLPNVFVEVLGPACVRRRQGSPSSPAIARRERTRCVISREDPFPYLPFVRVVCLVGRCVMFLSPR